VLTSFVRTQAKWSCKILHFTGKILARKFFCKILQKSCKSKKSVREMSVFLQVSCKICRILVNLLQDYSCKNKKSFKKFVRNLGSCKILDYLFLHYSCMYSCNRSCKPKNFHAGFLQISCKNFIFHEICCLIIIV